MNEKLPLLITEAIAGWGKKKDFSEEDEWIRCSERFSWSSPLYLSTASAILPLSHFGSGNCVVLTAVECLNISPNPLTPEKYVYFLCTI